MIYVIVDGEIVEILTEPDEALAMAKALAEYKGEAVLEDCVTGRRTVIRKREGTGYEHVG